MPGRLSHPCEQSQGHPGAELAQVDPSQPEAPVARRILFTLSHHHQDELP
jgi:hypothetical protein